ncbi:MAG TPA: hypothetical protein VFX79_03495 [Candidatus Saccharimonadales bacterium]|nr:hypothetical protein [Candidatus Saccharimonadales bacterium]
MKELFSVNFNGFFRNLFFSILGTALVFCLFFLTYSLVFNLITSKPEKVKDIFERSSLYSDLPAVLYDQTLEKTAEKSGSDIPLRDPEIRQIALDVYSPQFVRSNTEKLVDGIYGWLEGHTDSPEISLDFTEKNKEFAAEAGKYAEKRAKGLPVCSPAQIQNAEKFNALSSECLPSQVSPAQVRKEISEGDNALLDSKLTAGDIKTNDGKPLHESFSNLPKSFSLLKKIPIILFILAFILAGIAVYFSESLVSGLKRVSRTFLIAGILTASAPILLAYLVKRILSGASISSEASDITRTLFVEFMSNASKIYYFSGVLFILIAGGLYVYAKKLEKDTDKIPKMKS